MRKFVYREDYPVVQTKEGAIRGYEWNQCCIFKGIPYAEAQRFMRPHRLKPWEGVREAQSYGYVCPLMTTDEPNCELMVPHMYWPENENCLSLNIWTPSIEDHKKRPVMVWLHGGGFFAGSSIEQLAYDGENLCSLKDVVVVSLNHRLNVLGYLDLSPFGEEYEDSANAGNLDMIVALQWIKDNIAGFGGDPDNVTLFGQSGGGGKVCTLMQMPEADGLFHKGIIQSGVYEMIDDADGQDGRELVLAMLRELGLTEKDVDQLKVIPYRQLADAYLKVQPEIEAKGGYTGCRPHTGKAYVGDPLKRGFTEHAKTIPLMIGTVIGEFDFKPAIPKKYHMTRQEAEQKVMAEWGSEGVKLIDQFLKIYPDKAPIDVLSVDTFFRIPTIDFIKERCKSPESKTYSYQFTYEFPMFEGKIAWHCSEIPFVFHNIDKAPVCYRDEESLKLQENICDAWVSFAKTGKPEIPGVEWPACVAGDEAVMMLDTECVVKHNPDHELLPKVKACLNPERVMENVQH